MEVIKVKPVEEVDIEIDIRGAKNSVVAILPSCLLVNGKIILNNIPRIRDIDYILEVFDYLNIEYDYRKDARQITVYSKKISEFELLIPSIRKFRASYYFIGVFLARYGKIKSYFPGGCDFGDRPIDYHITAFVKLGYNVDVCDDIITIESESLLPADISHSRISVGATINAILSSLRISGVTTISNPATEPEVLDVISFLNKLGFRVYLSGNTIDVIGVDEIENEVVVTHNIIPDRISALSYLVLGAIKGRVVVNNVNIDDMESTLAMFDKIGIKVRRGDNKVMVEKSQYKGTYVDIGEHPSIPTDIQQALTVLFCKAKGTGFIRDTIYKTRIKHCEELNKLGASINYDEGTITILGSCSFNSSELSANDLRGAMALLIASICCEDNAYTIINNFEHIHRGYECIYNFLDSIGASYIVEEYN